MSGYQQANPTYKIPPEVLQALMQHLQQQQQMQNAAARAPMQTGAVGGPMPAAAPPTMPGATPQQGNTPMAGGPTNITGGGTPLLTTAGVQGQVPLGGQGVTAMEPRPFSGAPGGTHAHGGGNPFQISPNAQGPYAGAGGAGGGGAGNGGMKMDALGNYYYGATDPNATDQSVIKSAGQLLQNLNPVISGS